MHLTTHIGGSLNDELQRLSSSMVDAFEAWQSGEPLADEVFAEWLEPMA